MHYNFTVSNRCKQNNNELNSELKYIKHIVRFSFIQTILLNAEKSITQDSSKRKYLLIIYCYSFIQLEKYCRENISTFF